MFQLIGDLGVFLYQLLQRITRTPTRQKKMVSFNSKFYFFSSLKV